jgi:signal peptidase I
VIIANAGRKEGEQPSIFGYTFSAVQSHSMEPTFDKGDMVIGKKVNENTEIKVGDIISFYEIKNNTKIINTHRVIAIEMAGDYAWYYTMGDKVRLETHGAVDAEVTKDSYGKDELPKSLDQIVAVYQTHLGGIGGFMDFLKKPVGFIFVIVLPIVLVILWQIYRLIVIYMESKKAEYIGEAKATSEPTDEMKSAIIEEYLKSIGQTQATSSSSAQETPVETIEEKKAFLLKQGIALWDVISSCEIENSSDSSIRNAVPNDLDRILKNAEIHMIYTNGKAADKLYRKYYQREVVCLPSTSPANAAWTFEKLLQEWGKIRFYQ